MFWARFVAAIAQWFRTCSKLDANLGRFFIKSIKNNVSEGSHREFCSRAIFQFCFQMNIPPLKSLKVSKTWSYKEKEALIELWPSFECLYKTTSADYKRNDKRAAGVRAALETL